MIIYGILNKINHKMYVGKSAKDGVEFSNSRPHTHLTGKGSKLVFSAAKEYGKENFMVLVLHKENCNEGRINNLEKYYIKHFNTISPNGYNLTKGGDGGDTTENFSEEQNKEYRKKLSIVQRIIQNRPEVKKHKSEIQKIIQNRSETKKKKAETMSNPEMKKKHSENTRIGLNKPEVKKKRSIAAKIAMNKPEARKRNSEEQKIIQNRPEIRKQKSESSKHQSHIRWHVNRNNINSNCKYCMVQTKKELVNAS